MLLSYVTNLLLNILPVVIGLSIRGFFQVYTAYRLGDYTMCKDNRLTLHPFRHLDPMGFILAVLTGLGWSKPVNINPRLFRNPHQAKVLVSLSGPMINFALAFLTAAWAKILSFTEIMPFLSPSLQQSITSFNTRMISINLLLLIFNLLPLSPLDGYHVFAYMVPLKNREKFYYFQRLGPLLILLITITPLRYWLIYPVASTLHTSLLTLFRLGLNYHL